jgi:hypothetical protein
MSARILRYAFSAACAALFVAAVAAAQYDTGSSAGQAGWQISQAEAAARAVEAMREDPAVAAIFDRDPGLKKKLQQAYAKLALAQDAYSQSGGAPYKGAEANQFALAARREFLAVEATLRARAGAADAGDSDAEREQLRAEIRALLRDAKELLDRPAASNPEMLERRAELGRSLREAHAMGPRVPTARLRQIRDDLAAAMTDVRDAATGGTGEVARAAGWSAPDPLRQATRAFFAGEYRLATELLATASWSDPRSAKAMLLIRGASYFSLWVESGERDQALLDRAVADVKACQGLDASLRPDPAAFSPRYAELFR